MLKKINIKSNFKCFSNGNLKKKVENLNLKASKVNTKVKYIQKQIKQLQSLVIRKLRRGQISQTKKPYFYKK